MRNLRHYLRAQSQGHHTIDRLDQRGAERGSAKRSSSKGRERVIVNQTNIGKRKCSTIFLKRTRESHRQSDEHCKEEELDDLPQKDERGPSSVRRILGKGSAGRSSSKGRERAIVNQSNIGAVSKATFEETSERRGESYNYRLFRVH